MINYLQYSITGFSIKIVLWKTGLKESEP